MTMQELPPARSAQKHRATSGRHRKRGWEAAKAIMAEKRNPKLFREMNEPFNSREEMDAAHTAFSEGIIALREQQKIANVYVIVETPYLLSDGTQGDAGATMVLGDASKRLSMVAWAYGMEKQKHTELIARLLAGKE